MGQAVSKGNPGRKRTRFSKGFKLEAVRLLELGQKPATELAMELGIARNQLYKWQAQLGKTVLKNAFRGPEVCPNNGFVITRDLECAGWPCHGTSDGGVPRT